MAENKDRLALRMKPETRRKIDQWCAASGCHSMNQFVEQAVNFYADHLSLEANNSLPRAVSSALDGRLGMFEDRLSSLPYKQAKGHEFPHIPLPSCRHCIILLQKNLSQSFLSYMFSV